MILVLDNYDSFTWNLVHAIGSLPAAGGLEIRVVRNDQITPDQAEALAPSHIIVSPGPCTPAQAGASTDIIRRLAGRIPILGVCLGHQCIAAAFGMRVVPHPVPTHGKTSLVHHDGRGVFAGIESPMIAARYHSLIVVEDTIPTDGWEVSAWTSPAPGHARDERSPRSESRDRTPPARRTPGFAVEGVDEENTESLMGGGPGVPDWNARIVMGLRRVWDDPTAAPLEGVQFHPESFLTEHGPSLIANFLTIHPTHADSAAPRPRVERASRPPGLMSGASPDAHR